VRQVPLSGPDITEREIAAVTAVLRTPRLSMGPEIEAFERLLAARAGVRHAVAVNSGTSALHLAMLAAGIGPGDEVITSPFSFIASANSILFVGARPVFVDIDPVSLNMDPRLIEAAVTERTRAILAVHIFGLPCDMTAVMDVARRHRLTVIEDACEALGARWRGRTVGAFGQSALFAFYPNKQITTGEGGALVTDDTAVAALARSLRNQGRGTPGVWLAHERLGYNYRLDELSAALGRVQLERLDEILARRAAVAGWYRQGLASLPGVEPLADVPGAARSWFVYVVQLPPGADRDAVMAALRAGGVECQAYFPPIHLLPPYVERFGFRANDFPVAEVVSRRTVALPFRTAMPEEDVAYVCDRLSAALAEGGRSR
jgi:perosamine synthetase